MNIFVIGANSAIARCVMLNLKSDYKSAQFFCCARNKNSFAKWSPGLGDTLNGAEFFDFTDFSKIPDSVMRANSRLGSLDLVLIFHGASFDQTARESDFSNLLSCFNVNCLSTLAFLQSLQHIMAKQDTGTIAVATSVAGVRGRPKTFVYGSAKSAVSTYLEGLRSTLYHSGVKVYDLKLGPVDTPMTKGEKKHFLFSSPERVALKIVKILRTKRYTSFVPQGWFWFFLILKLIPESLFQRIPPLVER